MATTTSPPQRDCEVDVLVAGSGIGGLGSALIAASEGAEVVVVEKPTFVPPDALIRGRRQGTPEDTVEVIKFLASGDLQIVTKSITFDEIPAGLQTLKGGGAAGQRFVAEF